MELSKFTISPAARNFISPYTVLSYEAFSLLFMATFCTAHIYAQQRHLRRQNGRQSSCAEQFSGLCLIISSIFMAIQCGFSFHRIHRLMAHPIDLTSYGDKFRMSWEVRYWSVFDTNIQSPYGPNWITWFQFLLHIMTIWLLKGCYLGFFFRLAEILPNKLKIYLYTVGSFCVASAFTSLLLILFWCFPMSTNWTPIDSPAGSYSSEVACSTFAAKPVLITLTTVCVLADTMILILSILLITHLKLKVQSRCVSIFITVLLGILSIAAAVARLHLFTRIIPRTTFINTNIAGKYFEVNSRKENPIDLAAFFHDIEQCQWLQILFRIEVMQGVLAYGFTFGRHRVRVLIVGLLDLPSHLWRVCWGRIRYGKTDAAEVFVLAGKRRWKRRSSVIEISTVNNIYGRRRGSESYPAHPGLNTSAPVSRDTSPATTLRTAWYECPQRERRPALDRVYLRRDEESRGGTLCSPLGKLPKLSADMEGREASSGCDSKRELLGLEMEEIEKKGGGSDVG